MIYLFVLIALVTFFFLNDKTRWRKLYIFFKTFRRDFRLLSAHITVIYHIWKLQKNQATVAKVFTQLVPKHPNKVAFYYEDEKWTFQDVENFSNKVANFFKSQGCKRGDVVALFLEGQPEFVCIWLGLSKIGVITALINTNLVGTPLTHSINVVNPKCLIYGSALKDAIENIADGISNTKFYQLSEKSDNRLRNGAVDLRAHLETESDKSPAEEIEKGLITDKLILIYTSGTTGLPKAAIVTNKRFILVSFGGRRLTKLQDNDILYNPLPLYHSAGGMIGIGICLTNGISVVIKKKFSASKFWAECDRYRCTSAMYIGEMCRYLLNYHSNNNEPIEHPVKKLIGSGLRPQIWDQFVKKFHIEQVFEIYGATEGNANLMNVDNTPGAVGFYPSWASAIYPIMLIKCDLSTAEPIRGNDGFCQRCAPGEPGLLVGKVFKSMFSEFSGYVDKKATTKKVLRDVFKNGDEYFNTGDILVRDEMGYFYFRDRMGDTFRWKGENVATAEVEAVIMNILNLTDAVVYGVKVPNTEGRAGMVALVDTNNTLDLQRFCKNLKENLPAYSLPLFVRILESVPLTGTFKLKKRDFQKEGFDVDTIKDKLFMYDAKNVTYVELTKDMYNDIMNGKIRL